MQRSFGRLLNKAPGDNARVSNLLNDYEDADRVLAKLIDQARSWRDAWVNITNTQLGIVTEYEGLYDPIEGSARGANGSNKPVVPTPELQLTRTFQLKEAYAELRTDLMEEIALIDARVIKPTTDARDCIAPIRKTIKKRENRRLDYEKAQDKVTKLQRKPGKSAKEDAALVKAEEEVARAADEFNVADSHLRETLPPIVNAAFSIVPPVLGVIILIQNKLLGLYYTTLHNYCEEHDFPSPPPPMDQVIAAWSADYNPAKQDVEAIGCIAHGKGARMPLNLASPTNENFSNESRKASTTSLNSNGFRRTSSGLIPSSGANNGPGPMPPRPNRIPSGSVSPGPSIAPRPTFNNNSNLGVPTEFTTASGYGRTSPGASPNSMKPRSDYFGTPTGSNRPSTASTIASKVSLSNLSAAASAAAGPAIKKKPPPPPPPKRIGSMKPDEFVVALYGFDGQNSGDLSFREGDRIKVVKKTGTDQDWWVGEVRGVKGSFPANYCRAA